MKSLDDQLELPMEEDENIGDGAPRKQQKRRKSKEERAAERKIIFWTLLLTLLTTLFFWIWPKVRDFDFKGQKTDPGQQEGEGSSNKWKNYVEYKL